MHDFSQQCNHIKRKNMKHHISMIFVPKIPLSSVMAITFYSICPWRWRDQELQVWRLDFLVDGDVERDEPFPALDGAAADMNVAVAGSYEWVVCTSVKYDRKRKGNSQINFYLFKLDGH